MIVVSDASPIINLSVIGQLTVLRALYGTITIPQAVYDEVVSAGIELPGAAEVETSDWIEIKRATNRMLVAALELEVDAGEAEAIALAAELHADLLLLDERRGRVVAARLGLKFTGLLGVLLEAKHRGLIPALRPVMDSLIAKAGFWISRELYERILLVSGE